MGIFSRSGRQPPRTQVPTFGPGRALRSSEGVEATLENIAGVVDRHSPTAYEHMRPLNPARTTWAGSGPAPEVVVTFTWQQQDNLALALWSDGGGSSMALHLLGGEMQHPVIGLLKQADGSLSSVGSAPGGVLGLRPPPVPADYLSDLVATGGFDPSPANLDVACRHVCQMFLLKGMQLIGSQDPRAAEALTTEFPHPDHDTPQAILDRIVQLAPGIEPYVQDMPERMRGLLLEAGADGRRAGVIWTEMVATPTPDPAPAHLEPSAATTQGDAAYAADWYPDPGGVHEHRYHDGSEWTTNVSDGGVVSQASIGS